MRSYPELILGGIELELNIKVCSITWLQLDAFFGEIKISSHQLSCCLMTCDSNLMLWNMAESWVCFVWRDKKLMPYYDSEASRHNEVLRCI